MTAPGANYEFQEGLQFRDRTRGQAAIVKAVQEEIRRAFDQMELRFDGVRIGTAIESGRQCSFAAIRKPGNKIVLLQIWDTEFEVLDEGRRKRSLNGEKA